MGGDFYMNTSNGSSCTFVAGIMEVARDFTQINNDSSYRFRADEAHTVILNGTEPQSISLEYQWSYFGTLKVENKNGIIVSDYFSALKMTSSEEKIYIESDAMNITGVVINIPLVIITGDITVSGDSLSLYKNQIHLDGDLIHTGGTIEVTKGKLKVSGDYYMAVPQTDSAGDIVWITGSGKLIMSYDEDRVVVGGDFYMYTSSGSSCDFSAGLLAVAGDFTNLENSASIRSYSFDASGTHKVLLYGENPQNVKLGSYAQFNILQITQDFSQYTFSPDPCWVTLEEGQTLPDDCKLTYCITYDANGGYGAPEEQVKVHGTVLTLRETIPYRNGYKFLGWSTDKAATSAEYQSGDSFTVNGNTKLYAVWEVITYTVRYHANGGSGVPATHSAVYEERINLSTEKPLPANSYVVSLNNNDGSGIVTAISVEDEFISWNTQKNGNGNSYYPGQIYTVYSDVILYAQWDKAVLSEIADVEREGYYFIGWYDSAETDSNGYPSGTKYVAPVEIKEDVTLYAMWIPMDMLYYGDVSRDGVIDVADLAIVSRYTSGETDLDYDLNEFLLRSDLDRDGDVDSDDAEVHSALSNGNITQEELVQTYSGSEVDMLQETSYAYGEEIAASDFSLIVSFDAGASYTITDGLKVIGYDPYQEGAQTVRVAFYQFNAECEVTVDAPVYEEIANGYSGDLTWSLMSDGVLTFTGNGKMRNYTYKSAMPWYDYIDQITSVVLEDGVTSVGNYAFYGMPNLRTITIPEGVTSIGTYAFKNSTALDDVVLPSTLTKLGDNAFYGCTSLSSIDIPEGIYTIWEYTFKNCSNLKTVNLPSTLIKIDEAAFYGTAITELVIPDNVVIIGVYCFKNCTELTSVILPKKLIQIREASFYGTGINSLNIPEGVTKIGPYAFKNCTKLATLKLPETLTSIGEAAFYGSTVSTLVIPDAVTTIGSYAFKNCTSLVDLTLPESLISVSEAAFYNCNKLENLVIPDNVTTIGNYAFRKCESLISVQFSEKLTNIGESSFYGCTNLTNLSVPEGVTTIQGYAFKGCTSMVDVDLPDSLITLCESAFYGCTELTQLIIPVNVTSIGDYCFSRSTGLKEIIFCGNAPSIGLGAFSKVSATAYYPSSNDTWTADMMQNYGGSIKWMEQ